jgi:hypothetical protein
MSSLAVADSFQSLTQSIHEDRSLLQSLAALRPAPDGSLPRVGELHDIEENVENLELRVKEIQTFVQSERAALALLATLANSVSEQSQVVEKTREVVGSSPLLPGSSGVPVTDGSAGCIANEKIETFTENESRTVQLATTKEFESVPTSTRERSTLEDCNSVLASMQVALKAKLSLVALRKADVGKKSMAEWQAYHHRKHVTGDSSVTLTEAELTSLAPSLSKASRGKQRALISTLRHLKRLKQVQQEGKTLFVIL